MICHMLRRDFQRESGNDQRIELKIIHWIIYADRNKLHLKMLASFRLKGRSHSK